MLLNAQSLDAAKFATVSEARPVLSGLNVMKDRVAATDSYSMIEVMHVKQDAMGTPAGISSDSVTGIVPAQAAIHACKNIPKGESLFALKNAFSSVDADGRKMTLTTTDLMQVKSVEAMLIDGKFPDYEQVFPKGEPAARIMLDAKYLAAMAEYFEKHGDTRKVLIEFHGEMQPLVFKGHTRVTLQDVRGLVMPMRMPQDETGVVIDEKLARKMESEIQANFPDGKVTVTLNGK